MKLHSPHPTLSSLCFVDIPLVRLNMPLPLRDMQQQQRELATEKAPFASLRRRLLKQYDMDEASNASMNGSGRKAQPYHLLTFSHLM